jgi:hypothetical protein
LAIVRKRTRPSVASWWIWTAVGGCLCASYFAAGARASIWTPLSYAIGPLVTAVLALRYGERSFSRFDRGCLAVAALSILLWMCTGSPLLALGLNIGVDALGALPTLRKSWHDPGSEDRLAWGLFLFGNSLNLFAVTSWSFASASYPIYLFLIALLMSLLLLRSPGKSVPPVSAQLW